MLIQYKQIAIVGGGPGGLTLARLLQLKGASVKLYERDLNKDARVQGSPLDMHAASGMAAIRKANLLDEFKKNFRPGADKKVIVNERAEIFFNNRETKWDEDFGSEHFRPEIDRGALRKIFLESLQPETVVWDSHFISMEPAINESLLKDTKQNMAVLSDHHQQNNSSEKLQNEGWLLHFKNGSSAAADIVIAADGANSKIRPYITNIKAFYSGITMIEGNVYDAEKATPHIYALLNGGALLAFGNTKNLFMGLKGSGDLTFYTSFKADENWAANNGLDYSDKTQLLAWFKTAYSGWSSIWYELFENAATTFIPRPIYCMPLNQTWSALPNLTMLGDAAHVMPPSAGEGANMAMLDALELSECLCNKKFSDIQTAIASYENQMRKRAAAAAQVSLENGEWMHSTAALEKMLVFFRGK